ARVGLIHRVSPKGRTAIAARIFVGNVTFGTTADALTTLVSEAGSVVSVIRGGPNREGGARAWFTPPGVIRPFDHFHQPRGGPMQFARAWTNRRGGSEDAEKRILTLFKGLYDR